MSEGIIQEVFEKYKRADNFYTFFAYGKEVLDIQTLKKLEQELIEKIREKASHFPTDNLTLEELIGDNKE